MPVKKREREGGREKWKKERETKSTEVTTFKKKINVHVITALSFFLWLK